VYQRNLYLCCSEKDVNFLLVLDRIFFSEVDPAAQIKRIELLLEPNSEKCFKLKACGNKKVWTLVLESQQNSGSHFFELVTNNVVNHLLCNYLLKKLGLSDIMKPTQFVISLCEIVFGNCDLEFKIIGKVQMIEFVEDYPVATFDISRTAFEV